MSAAYEAHTGKFGVEEGDNPTLSGQHLSDTETLLL
jgi:hypothetical protein